jgi:hypothetical protein
MKFMILFLIAMLPVASIAQSQSVVASGVPSVAIPKTTGVIVIQTAKHGVTPNKSWPSFHFHSAYHVCKKQGLGGNGALGESKK